MTAPPQGITTELAKERSRAAAERTLTSWIQSSLTLMGFGLALASTIDAWNRHFPGSVAPAYAKLAPYVALMAIGVGLFLLTLAIVGHVGRTKNLEGKEFSANALYAMAIGGIIVFGIFAAFAVVVQAH